MEYRSYPPASGIVFSLVVFAIVAVVIVGGVWAIGSNVVDGIGHVANVISTGTVERNHTERTRIEADRDVEIARINADVAKKTDFTFVLFYLARFGVWAGSIAVLSVFALWIYEKVTDEPATSTH